METDLIGTPNLSSETIDKLTLYHWPGNVRELQNVLKRIIVLGENEDILDNIINTADASKHKTGWPNVKNGFGLNGRRIDLTDFSLKKFAKQVSGQVEKDAITCVLFKTGWNRSKASKILKVSYKTLITKIRELEIKPPDSMI